MTEEFIKAKKWYAGGLHFECIACGNCCSGPDEGYIWLKKAEITMLADRLGLTVKQVAEKYLRQIDARYSIIEEPRTKDCIFLKPHGNGKGCEVYDVRPNQCRTWPFWTMNLEHPDSWNMAGVTCPGINRGKYYSFDEIEQLRNQKKWSAK